MFFLSGGGRAEGRRRPSRGGGSAFIEIEGGGVYLRWWWGTQGLGVCLRGVCGGYFFSGAKKRKSGRRMGRRIERNFLRISVLHSLCRMTHKPSPKIPPSLSLHVLWLKFKISSPRASGAWRPQQVNAEDAETADSGTRKMQMIGSGVFV